MTTEVPKQYKHILSRRAPLIIQEAVKLYGIYEWRGSDNNPVILDWAKEVGRKVGMAYNADSIPWCGLFCGVVALRAGFDIPDIAVRAKAWLDFGVEVDTPVLGDVLVFDRKGGGHVGFYVGEDDDTLHVLGGNQSDQVNIRRMKRDRLVGVRRAPYSFKPCTAKPYRVVAQGKISRNEA